MTAWFAPLPPKPRRKDWPVRVSPGLGSRGVRNVRSILDEPTMQTRGLALAMRHLSDSVSLEFERFLAVNPVQNGRASGRKPAEVAGCQAFSTAAAPSFPAAETGFVFPSGTGAGLPFDPWISVTKSPAPI